MRPHARLRLTGCVAGACVCDCELQCSFTAARVLTTGLELNRCHSRLAVSASYSIVLLQRTFRGDHFSGPSGMII